MTSLKQIPWGLSLEPALIYWFLSMARFSHRRLNPKQGDKKVRVNDGAFTGKQDHTTPQPQGEAQLPTPNAREGGVENFNACLELTELLPEGLTGYLQGNFHCPKPLKCIHT